MTQDTKIQWCDHTFNPWRGCTKVAAGCTNCYAEVTSKRNPGTLGIWGDNGTRVVAAESQWKQVEKWNREAGDPDKPFVECLGCGRRGFVMACDFCPDCGHPEGEAANPRVFVASLADVFEDWQGPMVDSRGHRMMIDTRWPEPSDWACGNDKFQRPLTIDDVRRRLFDLIDSCPNLDFLLLTKRPENISKFWPTDKPYSSNPSECFPRRKNTWLITSIANQEDADRNIPKLLKCRDLVPVLGVSAEPLVGPVDLSEWLPRDLYTCQSCGDEIGDGEQSQNGLSACCHATLDPQGQTECDLDWVIAGGESGPNARPCNVEWIRSIRDQCEAAGVPCFVKQLGSHIEVPHTVGKRKAWPPHAKWWTYAEGCGSGECDGGVCLNHPKGGDPTEWPDGLRVREFPES